MKYGIYYAYWEKEWNGDYKYYIDKTQPGKRLMGQKN